MNVKYRYNKGLFKYKKNNYITVVICYVYAEDENE